MANFKFNVRKTGILNPVVGHMTNNIYDVGENTNIEEKFARGRYI